MIEKMKDRLRWLGTHWDVVLVLIVALISAVLMVPGLSATEMKGDDTLVPDLSGTWTFDTELGDDPTTMRRERGGPLTSTAQWSQRGELVIETTLPRGGTLVERWSLSDEGHLNVARKRKGERGPSGGLKSVYRRADGEIQGE